jgi:hypothetical protein
MKIIAHVSKAPTLGLAMIQDIRIKEVFDQGIEMNIFFFQVKSARISIRSKSVYSETDKSNFEVAQYVINKSCKFP